MITGVLKTNVPKPEGYPLALALVRLQRDVETHAIKLPPGRARTAAKRILAYLILAEAVEVESGAELEAEATAGDVITLVREKSPA